MKLIIISLTCLIAFDLWLDHYYDQQDTGYTMAQVKAVDSLVASNECGVGDWLCEIDKHSVR